MAKPKGHTAEDRANAIGVALSGIADDLQLGEVAVPPFTTPTTRLQNARL